MGGINEKGVYVGVNIVPAQKGITTGTTPSIRIRDKICTVMLSRYILDHYSSAIDAVEDITHYVSIYNSKKLIELGMEAHYMITDEEHTYILEFVNNVANKTKLLGLNASIEAARSGNVGNGFSVVAKEIGNLSISTKESASQIGEGMKHLSESIAKVDNNFITSISLIDEQVEALDKINQKISSILEQSKILNEFTRI